MITLNGKFIHTYSSDEGSFGTYYQISKSRGIKVFRWMNASTVKRIDSNYIRRVTREFNFHKQAYEHASEIVPKPIKLVYVMLEDETYAPAIIMEHIEGKKLSDFMGYDHLDECLNTIKPFVSTKGKLVRSATKNSNIINYVREALAKANLQHLDLHWQNILITSERTVKVIDFGQMGEL